MKINPCVFANCTSLVSVDIPVVITVLDSYVFQGCTSLSSIEIPESVKEISGSIFESCTSLTSLKILKSVTEMACKAFHECYRLSDIYCGGSKADWENIDNQATINVKSNNEYKIISDVSNTVTCDEITILEEGKKKDISK